MACLYILLGTVLVVSCNKARFSSRGQKTLESPPSEGQSPGDTGGKVEPPPIPHDVAPVQTTTVKLGINFEDRGLRGDRDYNDNVLCFAGKFEVAPTTGLITSLTDQQIVGSIHRNANCGQRITITIRHPDGTEDHKVQEPSQKKLIQEMLAFRAGSILDVTFQALGKKCDQDIHRVTEPDFVMFGYDECRSPAGFD